MKMMSVLKTFLTVVGLVFVVGLRAAGIGDYYSIENIAIPKGLDAQVGGLDTMPDGRLVACFHRGEVYTYQPKTGEWKLFADGLQEPLGIRAISDREVVVMQRPELTRIIDENGDGVADEKKLFYKGGPRGGNLEHQPSGLIWSMDNWLYTTYNAWRLRLDPKSGTVRRESTANNGGQWGLTQDNHGKPWYVNAGGERGPVNFQVPIVYGALNAREQFAPNYRVVYPLVPIPDVQGGTRRFRPQEKTLNHFTATCGQEIYRGDRLPKELLGNLFFGEPVGRLVRRTVIKNDGGVSLLSNPHKESEFIRTPDAYFRPINAVTAPDGTLYIVDMYRGIIQEGNWVRRGSYLRKVVQQYQLDKAIGRGRIWRLVHKDHKPGPQP